MKRGAQRGTANELVVSVPWMVAPWLKATWDDTCSGGLDQRDKFYGEPSQEGRAGAQAQTWAQTAWASRGAGRGQWPPSGRLREGRVGVQEKGLHKCYRPLQGTWSVTVRTDRTTFKTWGGWARASTAAPRSSHPRLSEWLPPAIVKMGTRRCLSKKPSDWPMPHGKERMNASPGQRRQGPAPSGGASPPQDAPHRRGPRCACLCVSVRPAQRTLCGDIRAEDQGGARRVLTQ